MNSTRISSFKEYTIDYYKVSPNAFFAENEFYQDLSENLKILLVKDYLINPKVNNEDLLLNQIFHTFKYLFSDT